MKRARCSVCRRPIGLYPDGCIVKHGWGRPCPGSLQKPLADSMVPPVRTEPMANR